MRPSEIYRQRFYNNLTVYSKIVYLEGAIDALEKARLGLNEEDGAFAFQMIDKLTTSYKEVLAELTKQYKLE